MRTLIVLAALLPTLVMAQGLTTSPPGGASKPKPLIPETAPNLVSHVYWNGKALVDLASNVWTMNGTVPQTSLSASPFKTGSVGAGAGPFSTANYYDLGTGAPLSFATGDHSICVVFAISSLSDVVTLVSKDSDASRGYWLYINNPDKAVWPGIGGQDAAQTVNQISLTGPNVVCYSYKRVGAGTSETRIQLNNGTLSVGTNRPLLAASTAKAKIGVGSYAGYLRPFPGTIYEVSYWSRALSNAEMAAIQAAVMAKIK